MRVLVVGGAGYIGSHVAVALAEAGHQVVVVDDLSNSSPIAIERVAQLVGSEVPLLAADVRNLPLIRDFVRDHGGVDAVIHLAGLKSVAESTSDPARYYEVNLGSTLAVLALMRSEEIPRIVFSGSATVYGEDSAPPFNEQLRIGLEQSNPYGRSKRVAEEILRDECRSNPLISAVVLRYFNPVGAHPSGLIGEDPVGIPTNLMPILCKVASGGHEPLQIFGNDYDTPDGTPLRDYIHVSDLARGHVAALESRQGGFEVFNLGTGSPVSVLELIAEFEAVTGRKVPYTLSARRAGDVARSFADPSKANDQLGWRAERSIRDAVRDQWRWSQMNSAGYRTASS